MSHPARQVTYELESPTVAIDETQVKWRIVNGHCVMNPCTGNQDCHFHEISLNPEQSTGPKGACVLLRPPRLAVCMHMEVRPFTRRRMHAMTTTTTTTGQFKPSPHPLESYIKITATAPKADGSGAMRWQGT